MPDNSPRKARKIIGSGTNLIDKNKEGASIAQGNELGGMVYNIPRAMGISFDNTENFNQSQSSYLSSASTTYNESEKLLQALEKFKSNGNYTATFLSNVYTLTATALTIGELVPNGASQDFSDKIVYHSPLTIADGFITHFVAPARNTASATIDIQKYDGTFQSFTLKKYQGASLVDLVANDITQGLLYNVVIVGTDAVLFENSSHKYKKNSIVSSPVGADARPSYISKVSETEITFAISPATPLVICFPSGDVRTITSAPNIAGLVGNAFYRVFIEKDGIITANDYNGTLQTYTRELAPTGVIPNGSYWFNNQGQDIVSYKRVGGVWVVTDVVQLAFFNKTAGVIGTIFHHLWHNANNNGNTVDYLQSYAILTNQAVANASPSPVFKAPSNGQLRIRFNNVNRGGVALFMDETTTPAVQRGAYGDDINSNTKETLFTIDINKDQYAQLRVQSVGASGTDGIEFVSFAFSPRVNK